jgi:hypothetical protein
MRLLRLRLHAAFPTMLLWSAAAPLTAQQVSGHVVDPATGSLVGVTVSFRAAGTPDSLAVQTDSLGRFAVTLPAPGGWAVTASRIGYQTEGPSTIRLVAGQHLELLVRLGAGALQLPSLEVRGVRQVLTGLEQVYQRIERQRELGTGRFLVRSEIERLNPQNLGSVLGSMSSQLRVVESPQMVVNTVFLRGGPRGSCPPAIFIDGFRVNQRPTNVNLLIEPRDVEAVELSGGAQAPIGFHDSGGCGSILVWSRRGSPGEGTPHTWWRYLIAGALVVGGLLAFR